MKIDCLPNTVLPIDERVIEELQSSEFKTIALDDEYLKLLPQFHGGVPTKPYFTAPNGEIRRIGWFVSFLDEQSPIPGPFQSGAHYDLDGDTRVVDRSIPSVFAYNYNSFFSAERMYPFAALYTDGEPITLLHYMQDFSPDDALYFDKSTDPQSIMLYSCEKAGEVV